MLSYNYHYYAITSVLTSAIVLGQTCQGPSGPRIGVFRAFKGLACMWRDETGRKMGQGRDGSGLGHGTRA